VIISVQKFKLIFIKKFTINFAQSNENSFQITLTDIKNRIFLGQSLQ